MARYHLLRPICSCSSMIKVLAHGHKRFEREVAGGFLPGVPSYWTYSLDSGIPRHLPNGTNGVVVLSISDFEARAKQITSDPIQNLHRQLIATIGRSDPPA